MQLCTETRIFVRLMELLLEHKSPSYELTGHWGDDRRFVYGLVGHEPEVTINFESHSHFELELRESELHLLDTSLTVPFDATDDDLKALIERSIEYLQNPHDLF